MEDQVAWKQLVELDREASRVRGELLTQFGSLISRIRAGLHNPGERGTAIDMAGRLSERDLQQLLPDLVELASFFHGYTESCRLLILRLPKSWLLDHLEPAAEPFLATDGDEPYRALIELYRRIDEQLAVRLARRAASHEDAEIREAGEDYLVDR